MLTRTLGKCGFLHQQRKVFAGQIDSIDDPLRVEILRTPGLWRERYLGVVHQEGGEGEPSHEGVIASSVTATFRLVWPGAPTISPRVQLDLFPTSVTQFLSLSSFPLPPLLLLLRCLLTDDQVDVVGETAVLALPTVAVVGVAGADLLLLCEPAHTADIQTVRVLIVRIVRESQPDVRLALAALLAVGSHFSPEDELQVARLGPGYEVCHELREKGKVKINVK